jgi:hypothetical protein
MGLVAIALLTPLAARYQICNFTCGEEPSWVVCRAEKCTPRLPEDACRDGSEAQLLPFLGDSNAEQRSSSALEEGFAVSGPQACDFLEVSTRYGSFDERCELCMRTVSETIDIVRMSAPRVSGSTAVCTEAAERVAKVLPTFRTCRLYPPACTDLVAAVRERVCRIPYSFEQLELLAGESQSASSAPGA